MHHGIYNWKNKSTANGWLVKRSRLAILTIVYNRVNWAVGLGWELRRTRPWIRARRRSLQQIAAAQRFLWISGNCAARWNQQTHADTNDTMGDKLHDFPLLSLLSFSIPVIFRFEVRPFCTMCCTLHLSDSMHNLGYERVIHNTACLLHPEFLVANARKHPRFQRTNHRHRLRLPHYVAAWDFNVTWRYSTWEIMSWCRDGKVMGIGNWWKCHVFWAIAA